MKAPTKLGNPALTLALTLALSASPVFSSEESDWLKALDDTGNTAHSLKQASGQQRKASRSNSREPEEKLADGGKKKNDLGSAEDNNMAVPTALLMKGNLNSRQLRAHADLNIKRGNIDEAIQLLERALEINASDLDSRLAYAGALEKRIEKQNPADPHTYNLCIKQWLYIYKSAEFIEDNQMAANHLKAICGEAPKRLQSTKAYLASVMLPDESESPADLEPIQVP